MSAAKGLFDQVPDIGITKKHPRSGDAGPSWVVDLSIYTMTTAQARQLAAELLNSADMADKLNEQLGGAA